MLKLCNVTAGYSSTPILEDFSLSLGDGDALCLHGPSGLGKTTIMMVAAGLLQPQKGNVVNSFAKTSFIFQDDRLLPWLTALDNILFAMQPSVQDSRKKALLCLDKLGLADASGKLPEEMSGGMRRRVNIARALATEPDLLLMDEAFSFLDEKTALVCANAILEWRQSRKGSILAISHDLKLTKPLGARDMRLDGPPIRNAC